MKDIKLPDDITEVKSTNPRDLVIVGQPKIGKGSILGALTKSQNALVLDLEKGGYEFIPARKISSYNNDEDGIWESFQNYIAIRNKLLESKGKYKFLIVDGLSDLDALSEIGGTLAYMDSILGKKFNRKGGIADGKRLEYGDPEWRSVVTLPDGAGYTWLRKWFMQQIEFFSRISPYRIYAAHVADKYINDKDKETVVGAEIALTGQLKRIFASKVTTLCKLIADGNERYLTFDVMNDSIIAGSRAPHLKDKILISKSDEKENIQTFWDNIYDFTKL